MNHRRFRQLTLVIALCAGAALGSSQQAKDEVVVLRSDERSLVFEYRPHYGTPQTIEAGNQQFVVYDFPGALSSRTGKDKGSPDLRFRSFPVGLPSEQGNAVQIIAADYEDIPNVMLAPIPSFRMKDDLVESVIYTANPASYAENALLPTRMLSLSNVGRMRSRIIGNVDVFPVLYNPATRTVRKYNRIVVEVVFGSPAAGRARVHDNLLEATPLLNKNVAQSWTFAPDRGTAFVITPSVLASGNWYRLTVSEEGIYRLDAQYFSSAGINLQGVDPRTIKIYGNGGKDVPENIAVPRPNDLSENAIYVEGEADGQFNPGDFVLFYGTGTRGWQYDRAARRLTHYINHYSEVNYYWLTFGGAPGRRMPEQPSLGGGATIVPDRFRTGIAVEEEKFNLLRSGKEWYGQTLSADATSFTHANTLPGLMPNDFILYRYSVAARSDQPPSFTIKETMTGTTLDVLYLSTVSYDGDGLYADERDGQALGISSLPNNQSAVNFAYGSNSSARKGWINWLEIQYPRNFAASSNYLRFRAPDTTGIVEYRLEQFTSPPFILNVTQHDSVRRITGAVGSYTFRAAETSGQISEYCAAASFKAPTAIQSVANQDLHGFALPQDSVDFIIITSREFRSAADRLKAYREQPAHGNLRSIVVDVDQIYNEFGGGIPDITAIRDYLKYSYDKWAPRLRFVLFFGAASYDYKGILGSRSSYVPTWQSPQSLDDIYSYSTDDFFVEFGSTFRPWLVTGRLTPRQPSEANTLVDKLIRYEDSPVDDTWKMRMIYVGDDGWTPSSDEGALHSEQAEILATSYTPDEFEKKKIYIAEYPTVITAQGHRKPAAYQAIIDGINRGALVVNFTGHGNPTVWTHESVFSTLTSIPQLINANKLAVYIAATCNFSAFDDPQLVSGGELLVNKPDGGGIAVISATRKVYSQENAQLHWGLFQNLFARNPSGRLIIERPATALFMYKSTVVIQPNDLKFFFLGDPTMRLQFPSAYASLDSINQQPVDSTGGAPRTDPIQLRALSRVTVKGTVRKEDGLPDLTYQGRVTLTVNDATRTVVIVNFSPSTPSWPYVATGGVIYRGDNTIRDGKFTAEFLVPKDILYADSTTRGRVVAYFSNPNGDGMGYTANVRVGGTDSTAAHDTQGPRVDLFLDSRSFRTGDIVGTSPTLFVDLEDASGINTSGSGIGHRIEAWVNNGAQSVDITDFYTGQLDDFRKGTVQYPLGQLPLGKASVRVRAWDTFNNSSVGETFFEVTSSDKLTIADVMNYPNPFAQNTAFTFRQNQLSALKVVVKIYTIAGRLIRTLESLSPGEPFVSIPWDGRDRDGDALANGVYLYKVTVKTVDGRFSSEALGKLSVLK